MDFKTLKEWLLFAITVLGWIVGAVIAWQRMLTKVNGLGRRVHGVEESCSAAKGRMDTFEKELAEYRRDTQDAIGRMSRVEKGVEELNAAIRQGNNTLGAQLRGVEMMIQANEQRSSNRLVRIETLQRVEQKLGPLPENGT